MEQLIEKMNKLLATSFAMYLKAHNFHWNVEGQDFAQYHGLFGDLYEELHGSVDTTAEQVRALGAYAKGSLADYKELSVVRDQMTVPPLQEMVAILVRDNQSVISVLNEVHEEATTQKKYGLINYIEGRLDVHAKHGWMLSASLSRPAVQESVVKQVTEEVVAQPVELVEEVKTYILNPNEM